MSRCWFGLAAGILLTASIATTCEFDLSVWVPQDPNADSLYRVEEGDHLRFLDASGLLLRARFPKVYSDFHDGLLRTDHAYLDNGSRTAISGFAEGADFSEGLAAVLKRTGEPWGFIDTAGHYVIKPRFSSQPGNFSGGLARVSIDHRVGYVDRAGSLSIAATLLSGEAFSEGMARVVVEGPCLLPDDGFCGFNGIVPEDAPRERGLRACKFTFIDRAGTGLPGRFNNAGAFREGLAPVEVGEKWGYIDRSGAIVIPPRYAAASSFSEGLAAVGDREKFGYIDKSGRIVVEPRFLWASDFHDHRAAVLQEPGVSYYIAPSGVQAFPGNFIRATVFFKGLANVELRSGERAFLDTNGRRIFAY
jgi:hypothetical protein